MSTSSVLSFLVWFYSIFFFRHVNLYHQAVSALVLELQKLYTATPKQGNDIYWDYVNNGCIVSTGSPGYVSSILRHPLVSFYKQIIIQLLYTGSIPYWMEGYGEVRWQSLLGNRLQEKHKYEVSQIWNIIINEYLC